MSIELANNKDHLVIKRDGTEEKYSKKKLKRAIDWCTKSDDTLTNILFESLNLKIYSKIKVTDLWEEVIQTAANLISEIQPRWDSVARRAYYIKVHKEVFSDQLSAALEKGVSRNLYDRDVVSTFTSADIALLSEAIDHKKDLNFTFVGLVTFMDKYAFNANQNQKLETPQVAYMRIAMYAFYKEPQNRIPLIIERYNQLSDHWYTEATPKMLNSLAPMAQLSSCCLFTLGDTTESINSTDSKMALLSKYGGGLALDVSALRASGSLIGTAGGKSSGPVPFIQKIQATVASFNQQGKRSGASIITFPFWHYDVEDLVMLKDAGGSDDKRARKLQYSIKWYRLLSKRIKANEDITLFDPKEVPLLLTTYGDAFETAYVAYENKANLKRKTIAARDLAYLVSKVRIETGNLYIFFTDNANTQRTGDAVYSSNLCQEVFLPSRASEFKEVSINQNYHTGEITTNYIEKAGRLALCNLSSINLIIWKDLSCQAKTALVTNLLRASDNLIDYSFYPVADGEITNRAYRAIGVGVSNYAQYMASKSVLLSSPEAIRETEEIFGELYVYLRAASIELAGERGNYDGWEDSSWAKGIETYDLFKHKGAYHHKDPIPMRFSNISAIAPTATSSVAINATEGIEPVRRLSAMKEGTYTLPMLAPKLMQYRAFYESPFDIGNKQLIRLAAARQKFLDQGQSVSLYYADSDSAYEIIDDIIYAEECGLKSLYYAVPLAAEIDSGCDSCGS